MEVYVTFSGPALSLLLFENAKSFGHQVGFLLGTVQKHVTSTLSDGKYLDEKNETIIHVDSILPVLDTATFIKNSGSIDARKLGRALHGKAESVVGWWTFRNGGNSGPTLRDRIVHTRLSWLLSMTIQHINQDGLIMAVLGSNVSNSTGTHSSKLRCLRDTPDKTWEQLPTRVQNLGDPTAKPYRTRDATGRRSEAFDRIVKETLSQESGEPDSSRITVTQDRLVQHLNKVATDISRFAEMLEKKRATASTAIKSNDHQRSNGDV